VPLTAADRLLLKRCLDHEPGAWREFVDRYLGLIYHVIQTTAHLRNQPLRPEDTEDLAADILTQVVAKDFAVLRRFKGQSSLAAYLTVIARRICLHALAAGSPDREQPIHEAGVSVNHDSETAPRGNSELENAEEVQRLLAKLAGRERQVVRMFYLEGHTYDEISEELGIPRNSIGPILTRARNLLRQGSKAES
jgi:RNA polymerase sigma-70 factor (ECF subfamily)